jgi:hypothetical protein
MARTTVRRRDPSRNISVRQLNAFQASRLLVRTTAKDDKVFLHLLDWPSSPLEISGLTRKVISARLLASGQFVKFRETEGSVQIDLPPQAPDPKASVVAVRTL